MGLEIAHSNKGIFLSQRKYTLQLIEDASLLASKSFVLPMDPNSKIHAESGTLLEDPTIYRQLIGCLLYLTISRPNITFGVHKLSQFVAKPRSTHSAFALIHYLKGCARQGVFLLVSSSFQLQSFSDAN